VRHHAGQNLHRVGFLALGGEARLAGTAAIEIPWLSPKVVTRNMWPKVLKDMVLWIRSNVDMQRLW
jgi:hypothetical protein